MKDSNKSYLVAIETIAPLLSALIKNSCVNRGTIESGDEIKNAELLHSFFSDADIPSKISTVFSTRSSISSIIEGSLENSTIYALMGHLDVVAAEPKEWSFNPFGGEIDDKWVYGRGAVDMLGQVAVMATAYRDIIKERGTPLHTIKFFGVADEEADGLLGAERLLREEPERYGCDYMITELGGYFLGENHIAINSSEKGVIRVKLSAKGTSAHGSMPYKADNAALKIATALVKLQGKFPSARITTEAREMIENMPLADELKRELLSLDGCIGALEKIWDDSPGLARLIHSALHITISPGVVKAGTKVNIIPSFAEARLDIRLQNGDDRESIMALLQDIFKGDDISISGKDFFAPNSSSMDNSFYNAISDITSQIYPDATIVPIIPAGVTDGRYWRSVGTTVYGYSLFSKEYTYDFFSKRLHGVDEKIDIESLALGYHFFYNLLSNVLY